MELTTSCRCGLVMVAVMGLLGGCSPRSSPDNTGRVTSAVSVPSTPCLLTAPFEAPVPAFTGTTSADGLSFSADGLKAYVSRKVSTNYDIYVATRSSLWQAFGPLMPLGSPVNSGVDERAPFLSQNGASLYMSRTNGTYLDVAVATWDPTTSAFGAPQFIAGLNSSVADQDPFFLQNSQALYFSSERPEGAQREIYVSMLSNGVYSPPEMVGGVNSPGYEDTRPILTSDGLTMYFGSTRHGIGGDSSGDVYVAHRSSTNDPFDTPTNVFAVNNSGIEFPVALSENGCTLYFASNEDTGLSASQEFRLYQATRGMTNPASVTVNLNIVGSGSVTTPPFNCSTGNVGTCSAQGAPGSTALLYANQQAMWTGSCAGNGGNPSTDGILVFSANGTCNVSMTATVRPTVACVANDNGTSYAVFGYENTAGNPVTIPAGPTNQVSPSTFTQLPTIFQPGIHPQVISVPLSGGSASWNLGGSTVVATGSSPSCGPLGPGEPPEENDDPQKIVPPSPGFPVTEGGTYVESSSNGGIPLAQVGVQASAGTAEADEPTLSLTHGDRGDRSTEVVIVNSTSLDMFFDDGFAVGEITQQPPSMIRAGSYGTFETRDGGFGEGTSGELDYFIGSGSNRTYLRVHWSNPILGSNSYDSSLDPPSPFTVDRIGGENALATVFFIVRPESQPFHNCTTGQMQWIIDNLKTMEPPLNIAGQGPAGVFTPAKRSSLGLMAWGHTGCRVTKVIGTIKRRAWSTDRFYTIDVLLDEFEGALLTGTNKAIRIEVDPVDPRDGNGDNPAHQAIQNSGGLQDGGIEIGRKILFNGVVKIDHGHFLEVHPFEGFEDAPTCGSPNEPLSCNPILRNVYTADVFGGSETVFMGRAQNRACFLITVDGMMETQSGSVGGGLVMADIDDPTGEWKLTVNAPEFRPLRGQARCVAANGLSQAYHWNGGPGTPMQRVSGNRGCYITRVGGDWFETSSHISINEGNNPATLHGGDGQYGSARCMEISGSNLLFNYILQPAPTATTIMDPLPFGCFYTQMRGPFAVMGGSLIMGVQAVGGVPRWTASVDGFSGGGHVACDVLTP
jgi:hypothetical protein